MVEDSDFAIYRDEIDGKVVDGEKLLLVIGLRNVVGANQRIRPI
jgi:hypothetical protein